MRIVKKTKYFILLLFSVYGFAQNTSKENIRAQYIKTENSKSGNYKDLFASFFQLAAKNFTGNEKSIEFNSTLFQLKAKANPELFQDINFKKEKFARNFQINLKVNLDDKFKYKGFTGGLTYAVLNERDRQIAVLSNTLYGTSHAKLIEVFQSIQLDLAKTLNETNRIEGIEKIENACDSILNGKVATNNEYYDKVITAFREKTSGNSDFENKELTDYIVLMQNLKNNEYYKIESKPLWLISVDGTANEKGKFNRASFSTIFLKGNKGAWNEIDIRAKLSYNDTILLTPLPRTAFNSTAGINFKIVKSRENVSFFEVKAALEYNHIFKNLMINEKQNNFLGNAEIRIRLADDLWVPLIIKYDIENANFLGFLNVSYNFGGLTTNTIAKK